MGQEEVGACHRVTCTLVAVGQAVEMTWLRLSGPILALVVQNELHSKVVLTQNRCLLADYCKFIGASLSKPGLHCKTCVCLFCLSVAIYQNLN